MNRFICIHGHFYQPPRENPWLEDIELQDSAYPFHDWNERITAECYEPNSASRILDSEGRIAEITSNYAKISFNFGPTLMSWLERHKPETYQAILEADRQSRKKFSGHGSALAQAYNHLIMPLANSRDKRTQVIWGIRDFVHRFGREPEGMWLPETAVDLETLEILAAQGIKFSILAPHQAKKVRKIGKEPWQDVEGGLIDPKRPYLCRLPSGNTIHLFFYDGPVSQEVAFSNLLSSGENFALRLVSTFSEKAQAEDSDDNLSAEENNSQLVHIATDGETYGHHHRFGDMALAYCLNHVEDEELAEITVYGEFLEKYPATWEVEIAEKTSWSCFHGVERWRSDCGCNTGMNNGWNQAWRAPLREAMDWLRDQIIPLYEKEMGELVEDPWHIRDDYIEVILNRSPENVQRFLNDHSGKELTPEETVKSLRLLEMQRHAMLMFTSCGWFFDEVSGIETTQILTYASRVMQLAEEACGVSLEKPYVRLLEKAPSNLSKWQNAARIYESLITTTRLDLIRVAAHNAITALLEEHSRTTQMYCRRIYCYTTQNQFFEELPSGRMKLAFGQTRVHSDITWKEENFSFAVFYFGEHNLNAGVRVFQKDQAFSAMKEEIKSAFDKSDIPEVIRLMDKHFGSYTYTLWYLFKDEQRKVLNQIMKQTLEDIEISFQQIYEDHSALMRFLRDINMPVPKALAAPVELVLNSQLRRLLKSEHLEPSQLKNLAEEVRKLSVPLDETMLGFVAGGQIGNQIAKLARSPRNLALLMTLNETMEILGVLPLKPDLWKAQNTYYAIYTTVQEEIEAAIEKKEATAGEWLDQFRKLGHFLQIRVV
jgi:alpha-amylase/alpha-mannosidase (GH57 family)